MERIRFIALVTILVLLSTASLNLAWTNGKAEEYHHALSLCFQHSADHAKALYDQATNGELNTDIADDYIGQISKDLDRARVYTALMHMSYSDTDAKLIAEDQREILGGHSTAVSAVKSLITEIQNAKPDLQAIKTLTKIVFDAANRAAAAHQDAMKKLGIPDVKDPSA